MYKPSQSSEFMANARTQGKAVGGLVMDRSRVANVRLDTFLSSHGIKSGSSAYPELDVAIFKATNHEEVVPKEKHVRSIKEACMQGAHGYVISKLDQRLRDSNHQWMVVLKILMVYHRMMRDAMVKGFMKEIVIDRVLVKNANQHHALVDFLQAALELVAYTKSMGNSNFLRMENFSDFTAKDTWDYASWIRQYSSYIWEKYQCYAATTFDCEKEATGEDSRFLQFTNDELIFNLPPMLRIMRKFQNCLLVGRAETDQVCLMSYKWVLIEGGKTQRYIQEGLSRLVEYYFELEKPDAYRVLEIVREYNAINDRMPEYWGSVQQIQAVKNAVLWGDNMYSIPPELTQQMEEHVREVPQYKCLPAGPQTTGEKPRSNRRKMIVGPVGQAQTVLEGTGIGLEKNRPLAITGPSLKAPQIEYKGGLQPSKLQPSDIAKKGIVAAPEADLLNFDDLSLNDNTQQQQQAGEPDLLGGGQAATNQFGEPNAFGGDNAFAQNQSNQPLQIANFSHNSQPQPSDLLNDMSNQNQFNQQNQFNPQQSFQNAQSYNYGGNNMGQQYGGQNQGGQSGALVVYGQQQPQNNQYSQDLNALGQYNTTGQTSINSPFVSNAPNYNQGMGQGFQQQQSGLPNYSMNSSMQQPYNSNSTGAQPQLQQQNTNSGYSYNAPSMISPNNQKLVVDMNTGLRKPQDPLEMLNQDVIGANNSSQTGMNSTQFPSQMLKDQNKPQNQFGNNMGYNQMQQQQQYPQYNQNMGMQTQPQQNQAQQNVYQPQVTGYNPQYQQNTAGYGFN